MSGSSVSADDALQRLIEGNERFLRGDVRAPRSQSEVLARLTRGQAPYATILGCSDSRVPPELVFDAGLGDLFVIRVAGNVYAPEVSGSLQYAGSHLDTHLFVVLGHRGCGAVAATLETKLHATPQRSRIRTLVDDILPGLPDLDPQSPPDLLLERAVEANVRWTMQQILAAPEAKVALAEGHKRLVGAVYDIASGRVRLL
jgi:carbonic anhydrase